MEIRHLFQRGRGNEGFQKKRWEDEERISKLEEEITYLRERDLLTGVYNRECFGKKMKQLGKEEPLAVLLVDIEQMRMVNRRFGEEAGNHLLKEVAGIVCYSVPDKAIVGRLEGDVFAIVLPQADEDLVFEVGTRILMAVREIRGELVGITDRDYKIRVSIGSCLWEKNQKLNASRQVGRAKTALVEAKHNGGDQQIEFSRNKALFLKKQAKREEQLDIEKRMRNALRQEEFFFVFQPQYNIMNRKIEGIEMLARWNHPKRGILKPEDFLPVLERNQFIIDLDIFLFEKVCQTLKQWKEEGIRLLPVFCNFSGIHCHNPFWAVQLLQLVEKYELTPADFRLEISVKSFAKDRDLLAEQLNKLKEKGFVIFLQDFGSGSFSVGVLQKLSIDGIKIDKELITIAGEERVNEVIFRGIVSLANLLNLQVNCVGIENESQLDVIKRYNCFLAQGNYFSSPLSAHEMETLMEKVR